MTEQGQSVSTPCRIINNVISGDTELFTRENRESQAYGMESVKDRVKNGKQRGTTWQCMKFEVALQWLAKVFGRSYNLFAYVCTYTKDRLKFH